MRLPEIPLDILALTRPIGAFPTSVPTETSQERVRDSDDWPENPRARAQISFPFRTTPMRHQAEALALCAERECLGLFMEPGTGKTKVALDRIEWGQERGEKTALVVCPVTAMDVWISQAAKHSRIASPVLLYGEKKARLVALRDNRDSRLLVVNYEGLLVIGGDLCALRWDVVVLDESTQIKSPSAKTTRWAWKLARVAGAKYVLSGRPVTQGYLDLYAQFAFLGREILGHQTFSSFKAEHAIFGSYGGYKLVGYKNVPALMSRVSAHSYRALKSDCLDLPGVTFARRTGEMIGEQKRIYKEMRDECVAWLASAGRVTATIVLTQYLRLQEIAAGHLARSEISGGGVKMELLKELLEELEGRRVVLSGRFLLDLAVATRTAGKLGWRCTSIHGAVPRAERTRIIEDFHAGKLDLIAIQGATGKFSIDLTCASEMVFWSNSYSLEDRDQTISRIDRHGQRNKCTVYDLVSRGTIDEMVLEAIESKRNVSETVMTWRP